MIVSSWSSLWQRTTVSTVGDFGGVVPILSTVLLIQILNVPSVVKLDYCQSRLLLSDSPWRCHLLWLIKSLLTLRESVYPSPVGAKIKGLSQTQTLKKHPPFLGQSSGLMLFRIEVSQRKPRECEVYVETCWRVPPPSPPPPQGSSSPLSESILHAVVSAPHI